LKGKRAGQHEGLHPTRYRQGKDEKKKILEGGGRDLREDATNPIIFCDYAGAIKLDRRKAKIGVLHFVWLTWGSNQGILGIKRESGTQGVKAPRTRLRYRKGKQKKTKRKGVPTKGKTPYPKDPSTKL